MRDAKLIMFPATLKQLNYIALLSVDCNFTIAQRRDFIQNRVGEQLEFWSDITKGEASRIIQELIDLKESKLHKAPADAEDTD